jgi:hypothetical protein
MKHFNKAGDRLFNRIEVHVFTPNGKKQIIRHHAGKGKGFNEAMLDKMLANASDLVEKTFPGETFRLVELGKGRFNIIHEPAPQSEEED